MSGGFFRGTSADQDTRFSNKQAKLMKSQKFAPELEHLVDITKVKMDVMKPWIAQRVTELLGFEDEVLINFIYGLLDGKVVNGKEIQISLTGFMEKNTGKFMKELWTLLLSAEKNASGVPQQFLDVKEEETRKKKVEADRITNEIQRRKEKEDRELEQEKVDKMDGKVDNSSRANNDESEKSLRHQPRDSSTRSGADKKETNGRNGSRGRIRGSPSKSDSKSFSNSRSRSDERHRSRSMSGSPQNRGHSVSSERMDRSPPRRSLTPPRWDSPQRSVSPSRRRASQYRQRSISTSHSRSPSPVGHKSRSPVRRKPLSPMRRRSRSPMRRRSRSPLRRRRSPVRYRSRSPVRYRSRSPVRYRARSPARYRSRSPIRRRSRTPIRRRSRTPIRRRSPSYMRRRYRRSPSSPRRRCPSPVQNKPTIRSRRRSPTPPKRLSSSPHELSSQSPIHQAPPSPVRRRSPKHQRSLVQSPRERIRKSEQYSPVGNPPLREKTERPRKGNSLERPTPMSTLRSPQRDPSDRNSSRRRVPSLSPSPYKSPSRSESPPASRKRSLSEDRRSSSPYGSPPKQTRDPVILDSRPSPPRKPIVHKSIPDSPQDEKAKAASEFEYSKHKSSGKQLMHSSTPDEGKVSVQTVQYNVKGSGWHESETLSKTSRKIEERNNQRASADSDSEGSEKHRSEVNEKRKHKRSKRQESDDDGSYDSQLEGRKEAKRRRKEEKRLRKEERRRRREERRRRKEERRAEKIKSKSIGTVSPPSDLEENHDGYTSFARRELQSSDTEEAESEQKKLEIALRQKALESLRAKKGSGH